MCRRHPAPGGGQGDGQEPGAQPPRRQQAVPAQVAAAGGVAADSGEPMGGLRQGGLLPDDQHAPPRAVAAKAGSHHGGVAACCSADAGAPPPNHVAAADLPLLRPRAACRRHSNPRMPWARRWQGRPRWAAACCRSGCCARWAGLASAACCGLRWPRHAAACHQPEPQLHAPLQLRCSLCAPSLPGHGRHEPAHEPAGGGQDHAGV